MFPRRHSRSCFTVIAVIKLIMDITAFTLSHELLFCDTWGLVSLCNPNWQDWLQTHRTSIVLAFCRDLKHPEALDFKKNGLSSWSQGSVLPYRMVGNLDLTLEYLSLTGHINTTLHFISNDYLIWLLNYTQKIFIPDFLYTICQLHFQALW